MELAAKIIFISGAWYLAGLIGMQYIRHALNEGKQPGDPGHEKLSVQDILALAMLGLVVIAFIIYEELRIWINKKHE